MLRKEQKLLLTKSFRVSALCHAHICDVTLGIFHLLSKDLRFITHWGVVRSESCSKLSGYREAVQLQFSAFMEAQNVMQLTSRGWQRERSYHTPTKSQIKFPLAGPCCGSTY